MRPKESPLADGGVGPVVVAFAGMEDIDCLRAELFAAGDAAAGKRKHYEVVLQSGFTDNAV